MLLAKSVCAAFDDMQLGIIICRNFGADMSAEIPTSSHSYERKGIIQKSSLPLASKANKTSLIASRIFKDAVRLVSLGIFRMGVLMLLQCRKAQHLLSGGDTQFAVNVLVVVFQCIFGNPKEFCNLFSVLTR